MTDFTENLIKVRGSISDKILSRKGKIKIRLVLKDGSKGIKLILTNLSYFSNNSPNLINLGLLNTVKIYYHNKNQIIYYLYRYRMLVFG